MLKYVLHLSRVSILIEFISESTYHSLFF